MKLLEASRDVHFLHGYCIYSPENCINGGARGVRILEGSIGGADQGPDGRGFNQPASALENSARAARP